MKKSLIILIILIIVSSLATKGQNSLVIIVKKADSLNQFEDIQYSSISLNQTIDFDKLIRVYVNSKSKILVDHSISYMDDVGKIVYDKLKTNIETQTSPLTIKSAVSTQNDLKILIKKSVYTNKDDYKTILDMVNNAIWDLMKYSSNKVYGKEYKLLNTEERNNIKKLVPLKNYLAEDVKF